MMLTQWKTLGKSVLGKDINTAFLGIGDFNIFIMACIHGDETLGTYIAKQLLSYYEDNTLDLQRKHLIFLPLANPDGYEMGTRGNYNKVDINRNFPTNNWDLYDEGGLFYSGPAPASEPETKVIMDIIDSNRLSLIISLHQPYKVVNYDGPARKFAEIIAKHNKYEILSDIGYQTPGSLGTYAGVEKDIPIITLELPENEHQEEVWKDNALGLINAINYFK